jgi:hypothetical protein
MSESRAIDAKLQGVEDRLEQLRGELEKLSAAIWNDINHDDQARLEEGVRFKQSYNERRGSLEGAMDQMLTLLREYRSPDGGAGTAEPMSEVSEPEAAEATEAPQAAPDQDLGEAQAQAQTPFTPGLDQKVPFGFILDGKTFTSASAWPLFYEALLQELYGRAPEKLKHLVDAPAGFGSEDRPLFARVPDTLDEPLPIADSIFAEADLAPEALLQVIKRLIGYLGYPLESFKVLLKEKNRGTVETLSLAA